MKTRFLIFIGMIGLSVLTQSYGDNEFCNIVENLKIKEELIKDDIVLIEFLKVFPDAKLIRANYVDTSNPGQTSMTWTAGVYSLDIHIWGFDIDNPSDCFVPGGYRLNAPHLPEMVGLDYHKDPKIVLKQIEELEPNYVKGGPAPMSDEEFEPIEHIPTKEQTANAPIFCIAGYKQVGSECVQDEGLKIFNYDLFYVALLIVLAMVFSIVIYMRRKRK